MARVPHIRGHAPVSAQTASKLRTLGFNVMDCPYAGYVLQDKICGEKAVASMAKQLPQVEFVTEKGATLLFWHVLQDDVGRLVEQTAAFGLIEVSAKDLYPGEWFIARDTFCIDHRTYLVDGCWSWKRVPSIEEIEQEAASTDPPKDRYAHSALSRQEGGNHYQHFVIQPAEFIRKNREHIGYTAGCVIKYVCRAPFKDGVKDLKKAQHYLEMMIEDMEEGRDLGWRERDA